jgi:hypothetical protein
VNAAFAEKHNNRSLEINFFKITVIEDARLLSSALHEETSHEGNNIFQLARTLLLLLPVTRTP